MYAFGTVSGGHLNPSISISMQLATHRLSSPACVSTTEQLMPLFQRVIHLDGPVHLSDHLGSWLANYVASPPVSGAHRLHGQGVARCRNGEAMLREPRVENAAEPSEAYILVQSAAGILALLAVRQLFEAWLQEPCKIM